MEDKHIIKRQYKSLLLYHIVCPTKYCRKVFTEPVEKTLKEKCKGIYKRYEISFVEIGADKDHVRFLIQSVPTYSPKKIVQTIKSITAIQIFKHHPEVKQVLWGGKLWTSGYYVNTVGQYVNADTLQKYVQNQGKKYRRIYRGSYACLRLSGMGYLVSLLRGIPFFSNNRLFLRIKPKKQH